MRMHQSPVLLVANALLAAAFGTSVLAGAPSGVDLMPAENPDASFVREAGMDNLTELELGRMAAETASSAAVRDFARELVAAQDLSIKDLRLVAAHQKLSLPAQLDAAHARVLGEVSDARGADFDAAFLAAIVDQHHRLVGLLERAQGTTSDTGVKKYVRVQLPIAREHLATAEAIHLR